MPWSQRAFAINLLHVSSQVFVGVFGYNGHQRNGDDATTDVHHVPLGRVVINLCDFRLVSFWHFLFALRCTDLVDSGFEHLACCARMVRGDNLSRYMKNGIVVVSISCALYTMNLLEIVLLLITVHYICTYRFVEYIISRYC